MSLGASKDGFVGGGVTCGAMSPNPTLLASLITQLRNQLRQNGYHGGYQGGGAVVDGAVDRAVGGPAAPGERNSGEAMSANTWR